MTDTTLDLLAAIRDQPDDNILRIAYADHLDGLDTVYPHCENCNGTRWEPGREGNERCSDCLGVGPDLSNADRAEFIRVQCEEASILTSVLRKCTGEDESTIPDPLVVRHAELRRRETALRTANEAAWRRGPVCGTCKGRGKRSLANATLYSKADMVDCPPCDATGDMGGLLRSTGGDKYWVNAVTYHRGMKRVECRAEDVWVEYVGEVVDDQTTAMYSTPKWEPTPWALAVCKHHPDVVEMWVDLPFDDGGRESWLKSSLPEPLFHMIEGHGNNDARIRLARGVVRWVHNRLKTSSSVSSTS